MNITALTEATRAVDSVCADQETAIEMLEDAIKMLRLQQEHECEQGAAIDFRGRRLSQPDPDDE